jgi:hypothetical protein
MEMSSPWHKLAQRSPLEIRPLRRRALVFAGAALLLLAGVGFCIASQRSGARFQAGIAVATPNTHVVACEANHRGIRLFYNKGQVFGIPLTQQRVSFWGCGVSINTRLQGTDTNIFAPWWLIIASLSVLLTLAGRDVRAGLIILRRNAGRLCGHCGYDLRATPERCPECGATPHNPPMQRTGAAGIFSGVRKWFGRGSGR